MDQVKALGKPFASEAFQSKESARAADKITERGHDCQKEGNRRFPDASAHGENGKLVMACSPGGWLRERGNGLHGRMSSE